MQVQFRVLTPQEMEDVIRFETKNLERSPLPENEKMVLSWRAPWRKESLEYYLPKGWSFGAWSPEGELAGYFIAQPILFFRGQTQTLWIEHMGYNSPELRDELIDLARRYGRDKHLQSVIVSLQEEFLALDVAEELSVSLVSQGAQPLPGKNFEFATTKRKTY